MSSAQSAVIVPDLAIATARPAGTAARTAWVLALLCCIWGSTWLVIRIGLTDLPPITAAASRFAIAALVMTIAAPWLHRKEGGERPSWKLALTVGAFNFGVSYAAVYLAERDLPSGLASCLWSSYPMMIAAAAHLFIPGERSSVRQALGLLIGFAGVAVLLRVDVHAIGPRGLPAAGILLVSPLAATIGTTVLKRTGGRTSSVLVNRDALWVGAASLALAAWLFERGSPADWSPRAVATVVYLALVGTALAFGLYFHLLRSHAAHRLGLISYVTPVLALAIGAVFAGEPLTLSTAVGTALILCGVALVLGRRDHAADRN